VFAKNSIIVIEYYIIYNGTFKVVMVNFNHEIKLK